MQVESVAAAARMAHGSADRVEASLELAAQLGDELPSPGVGQTWALWSSLASIAAVDLTVARVVEPHLDALAILRQASGDHDDIPVRADETWGVFAAEGAGVRVTAERTDRGWMLDGVKPWCSLAGRLDRALITAWVNPHERGLFAIDLRDAGVHVEPSTQWVGHGLPTVTSTGVRLEQVAATPIGAPGWYLVRPGFAWGGIGVAAIWYGAAVALADRVRTVTRPPDQIAELHAGQLDVSLWGCEQALRAAAELVDAGCTTKPDVLAHRVRAICAYTAEDVLGIADHALGPGPLATETDHAQRVSDLRLYVRQHHAERDLAALGKLLIDERQL